MCCRLIAATGKVYPNYLVLLYYPKTVAAFRRNIHSAVFCRGTNKKEVLVIADKDPERKEQKVGLEYKVQPGDIFTVRDTFF